MRSSQAVAAAVPGTNGLPVPVALFAVKADDEPPPPPPPPPPPVEPLAGVNVVLDVGALAGVLTFVLVPSLDVMVVVPSALGVTDVTVLPAKGIELIDSKLGVVM